MISDGEGHDFKFREGHEDSLLSSYTFNLPVIEDTCICRLESIAIVTEEEEVHELSIYMNTSL